MNTDNREMVERPDWLREVVHHLEGGKRTAETRHQAERLLEMTNAARGALGVVTAARDFCAELCEDADGVPQRELKRLHLALDVFEATPDDDLGMHDDSTPESTVMAALKWVAEDGNEPDSTRRAVTAAIHVISQASPLSGVVGERDRLREALNALQQAEAIYRYAHDILGSGDTRTGRAWDLLQRAGDKARAALNNTGGQSDGHN